MFRSKKSLRAVVIMSALIAVASFAVAAPLGGWGWLTQGAAAIGFPGMVSRIADDPAGRSVSDAGGIFTNDTGIGNAGLGSPELGQTLMPIGAQTGTFNGDVRGYFFTAPVNFNIVGLRVPADQAGNQSIAVVRFNTPPPVYTATTNDFTTLFLTQSNADPGILPVNIPVQTGDIIGVLGYRGTTNSYTNVNASTIFGQPVTLARLGMQFPLTTNAPHDLWSEPTSSNISRVELYYDDFVGGSTPTPTPTPPPATPTPTPPPASPSPTPTPGPSPSCTPTLITEGFDTITANVPGAGWFAQNNSAPVGSTTWFQGNSAVFPSHTGAPTSYIGGNFNSTAGAGTISTWLLTPQVTLQNGAQMTFWTRGSGSSFPDRLQVRMSTAGASTNVGTLATDVGDFTALMLDINPTYQTGAGGYPAVWTQQTITVTGVPVPTQGRFAFRYFVENGGPSGANSDYIGIDTFQYGVPCGPVPTPSPGVTPTPTPTPPPATPTPTPPPGCAGQSFPATTGMPASPPDNNPTGVTVDIPVSGLTGTLTVAQLRDWTWSNPHTWGGDIKMTLQAPSGGPTATIVERRGNTTCPPTGVGSSSDLVGPYNFGDAFAGNFHTVAGNPVPAGDYFASQCVTTPGEKVFLNTVFAGPVRPTADSAGIEVFDGMAPEAANGTWKLMMSDGAGGDTGTVSAVNLCLVAGGGGPSPTPTPPPASPTPSPNPSPSPTCVPGSGSLATSTVSNNGTGGVFLQLTPTSSALTVTSFDTQFGGAAGTPGNVEVWTRPGPYAGFTTSNVGWTLHETAAFTSAGTITNAPLVLTTPLNVPVGTTSIYLHSITTGNGIRYFGTGTTSTTTYNNADVTMFTDIARTGAVAFGGSQFTPRAFSGNVNYTTGGACPTPTPSPGVTPSPTPPPASPTPSPNPSPSVNPTPSPSPTCAPTSGVLHDNGGLATGTTTESGVSAPAGTQWSEVQHNTGSTTEANTSAGFSCSVTATLFRCADDFTVPPGETWTVDQVTVFAYQTGFAGATSPINAATLQIWNGRPGDVGATVVFGDTTTNRLGTSTDALLYRVFNTAVPPPGSAPGTTRRIWQTNINVAPAQALTAGTYWIDWNTRIGTTTAHFAPSETVVGFRTVAGWNARQFTGAAWADALDTGNPASAPDVAQDFPFKISGTSGGGCPTPTPSPGVTPTPTPTPPPATPTPTPTPNPSPSPTCPPGGGSSQVVPPAYTSTQGTSTFTGPLANSARTYQLLINANQLTGMVGQQLTGLTWRLPISATVPWPAADVNFANYDIRLSGSVDPALRSLTFANNVVGPQTLVRSGPLTVTTNSYTSGNTPNAFGPDIAFGTPWLYTGGHLLVEIRHDGFTGTSRSVDGLSTSTPGYGTDFSAAWTGSYAGLTGAQGNFSIARLTAGGGGCPTPSPTPGVTPTPTPPPASPTPSPGGTPEIRFGAQTYYCNESMNGVITLVRNFNTTGTNTVNLQTSNGTAVGGGAPGAGIDYQNVNTNVTFLPTEASKNVNVPCFGDTLTEATETVNLTLSGPFTRPGGGGDDGTTAAAPEVQNAVMNIIDTASAFRFGNPICVTLGGTADAYPAPITVAGGPASIAGMRVTLYDLSYTFPDHIDALLVGPGGQKFVIMGDAGGALPIPPGSPVTLSFRDIGPGVLPNSGPLVTGNFEPTTWETPVTSFPGAAPAGPYSEPGSTIGGSGTQTFAGNFGGTNANGVWNLWIRDDAGVPLAPEAISGCINGGWGIEFLSTTAANASISGRVLTADGRPIRNVMVSVTGNSLPEPRVVQTGSFGYYNFDGLRTGETYVITVQGRRYFFQMPSQVVSLTDNIADLNFIAIPDDTHNQ